MSEFFQWSRSSDGFWATDPWNMYDLYELKLDSERLGDSDRFEICVLRLQALGRKAIVTWQPTPVWTETFFELGINTTWYDDIHMQIVCSGEQTLSHFWIGTRLPTADEISAVYQRHPL
ncbi:hypothetical protein ACQKQD_33105 [Methylobacterium sp. NPDC080182]|uniref:hypothetical protein n=1 Tax=Methylobacterium sp. NPDC080182 TaxID=3390590 RepID=UPI003D06917C